MITFKLKINIQHWLQSLHEGCERTDVVSAGGHHDGLLLVHHHDVPLLLPVLALQTHQSNVVREAEHLGGLPQMIRGWPVSSLQRFGVIVEAKNREHGVDCLTVTEVQICLLIICTIPDKYIIIISVKILKIFFIYFICSNLFSSSTTRGLVIFQLMS